MRAAEFNPVVIYVPEADEPGVPPDVLGGATLPKVETRKRTVTIPKAMPFESLLNCGMRENSAAIIPALSDIELSSIINPITESKARAFFVCQTCPSKRW